MARAGAPHTTAIAARSQSAGRGRSGRRWDSPPGGLYLSLVVRLNLPLERWGLLPLAAGLAVGKTVEQICRDRGHKVEVQLKWPNDLLLDGGKLGGLLCQGTPGEYGVVGLGLNLNGKIVKLDDEALLPPIHLAAVTGEKYKPERVAQQVRHAILEQVARLESEPTRLLDDYRSRCISLGKRVCWADGEGVAYDINPRGELMVHDSQGQEQTLTEEVHLV